MANAINSQIFLVMLLMHDAAAKKIFDLTTMKNAKIKARRRESAASDEKLGTNAPDRGRSLFKGAIQNFSGTVSAGRIPTLPLSEAAGPECARPGRSNVGKQASAEILQPATRRTLLRPGTGALRRRCQEAPASASTL